MAFRLTVPDRRESWRAPHADGRGWRLQAEHQVQQGLRARLHVDGGLQGPHQVGRRARGGGRLAYLGSAGSVQLRDVDAEEGVEVGGRHSWT